MIELITKSIIKSMSEFSVTNLIISFIIQEFSSSVIFKILNIKI